jgi:cell division protein FtsI (penicillin-binding protein 3)
VKSPLAVLSKALGAPAGEPWRRRLARTLLYGPNVDRAAKAKARVGLAIVAFSVVYAIIALRLVLFAVVPDGHIARRAGSQDAVATARPDILDRNGQILATDVKLPSLFGEPRRIIDVDEATELLTAVLPDLDAAEVRERLGSKRGFAWLKREIKPRQQHEIHRLGIPGIGFLSENKRVYPNGAEVSHLIGHVNIDNQGIAGIESGSTAAGSPTCTGRGSLPTASRSQFTSPSISGSSTRCATN